ncbi:MAG: MmgE/PrpD family protein [Candidatus Tectomicrobia bacterium]
MPNGATRQLAAYVATTPTDHFPDDVMDRAKYFVLDYLGVALRGSHTASSAAIQTFIDGFAPGNATIVGRNQRAHPAYAALANGAAEHSLEMDDTHQAGSIHLGAPIVSALIAASEMQPVSGREFLAAMIVGYEVAARVAMAVGPAAHYQRGFHPTGTCGAFGTAAAVSRVWGLDTDATAHALGIAGSQTAGSMEFLATGAWTKRLHPGWAAHNGIIAAGLARSGFTGPDSIFEGRDGFVRSYSNAPRVEKLTEGLGSAYEILHTAVKPHTCCRYMQAPIDALLELSNTHDFAADDVSQVTIGVLETAFPIICEPAEIKYAPRSVVDAQFSMPFGAAVALLYRRASLAEFSPEVITSPRVHAMMQRVTHARDAALDKHYPQAWPAWAHIALRDGRHVSHTVHYPKGDPQNPLSWEELMAKYEDLGSSVLPADRLHEVCTHIRQLDQRADVSPLWQLLRPIAP